MGFWLLEKILSWSGLFEQASAQIRNPISITLRNPLSCDDFGCVANRIIDGLFALSIPIVSVMVLVGGFQILFATGDPEKLKTGKKTVLYSVVGFTVILLAKGVVLIIQNFFT